MLVLQESKVNQSVKIKNMESEYYSAVVATSIWQYFVLY
jgi:hypothetical protein